MVDPVFLSLSVTQYGWTVGTWDRKQKGSLSDLPSTAMVRGCKSVRVKDSISDYSESVNLEEGATVICLKRVLGQDTGTLHSGKSDLIGLKFDILLIGG